MSPTHDNALTSAPADQAAKPPVDPQLAHELSNLLDGSLRQVGLAVRQLKRPADAAGPADDAVLERLETAAAAMQQMVRLLHERLSPRTARRWMQAVTQETVGDTLRQTMALLRPQCELIHAKLQIALDAAAAELPAGPLGQVVLNAVRNSLRALESVPVAERRLLVEVIRREQDYVLAVRDSGPGLPAELCDEAGRLLFGRTSHPDGHGLGLALCAQLAQQAGGTLVVQASDDPDFPGAQLLMTLPLRIAPREQGGSK